MPWARLDDDFHDHPTAVYRLFGVDDALLYVGIAAEPFSRLDHHYRHKSWWGEVAYVEITWYASRSHAVDEELSAIRDEAPLFNIQGRGGPLQRRATPSRPAPTADPERFYWRGDT